MRKRTPRLHRYMIEYILSLEDEHTHKRVDYQRIVYMTAYTKTEAIKLLMDFLQKKHQNEEYEVDLWATKTIWWTRSCSRFYTEEFYNKQKEKIYNDE